MLQRLARTRKNSQCFRKKIFGKKNGRGTCWSFSGSRNRHGHVTTMTSYRFRLSGGRSRRDSWSLVRSYSPRWSFDRCSLSTLNIHTPLLPSNGKPVLRLWPAQAHETSTHAPSSSSSSSSFYSPETQIHRKTRKRTQLARHTRLLSH